MVYCQFIARGFLLAGFPGKGYNKYMQQAKTRRKDKQKYWSVRTDNKLLAIIAFLVFFFSIFLFTLLGKMLFSEKKITFDQANKVLVVKGDVRIKKAGAGTGWDKAGPSVVLEKGDIIETSEASAVDIVIGSNTDKSVRLEKNTRVEFEGINPTHLNLPKGKILIALKKLEPRSSFTVKTPSAICGARGTAWMEEVSGDKTKVCVFENNIYAREIDDKDKPRARKHTVNEGTQRILSKAAPISKAENVGETDISEWLYWKKNVSFLREGKLLVNDFNKKENYNNLGGPFGSWNIFYSDPNQYCKDELTGSERTGDSGYALRLDYDVDSPYSAYNGFFTNLMGIDLSEYNYLVFYIKGDKSAGFTNTMNVELKNKLQVGKVTVEGITDEWQRIVLPLSKFVGINSFKEMKEFVIVFSDRNVTKKSGVIYIDNIYFVKTEPLT